VLTPCNLDNLRLRGNVEEAAAGGVVQTGVLVADGGQVSGDIVFLVCWAHEVV
jgi:hypothetical protein